MATISFPRRSLIYQCLKVDAASINDFSFLDDSGDTAGRDTILAGESLNGHVCTKMSLYASSTTGALLKLTFDSGDFQRDKGLLLYMPAGESINFNYEGKPFSVLDITYLSSFEDSPSIEILSIVFS